MATRTGRYAGFPSSTRYTPVPNALLGPLLEEMDSLEELKCTLRALALLSQKKGFPKVVRRRELERDSVLVRVFSGPSGEGAVEAIGRGLGRAVGRGILLRVTSEGEEGAQELYLLNTEANQRALARMEVDALISLTLEDVPVSEPAPARPNIFALYEENIGILTPIIAEELKEAEASYPKAWIEEAFREAVERNKRSWRYIARILERWSQEGRGHGEPGRHPQKSDPKAYLRGWRRG